MVGVLEFVKSSDVTSTWVSFSPTFININVSNGLLNGRWRYVGQSAIEWRASITFGSTTTVGGSLGLFIPNGLSGKGGFQILDLMAYDTSASTGYIGRARLNSDNSFVYDTMYGPNGTVWNATTPITWAEGDQLFITGTTDLGTAVFIPSQGEGGEEGGGGGGGGGGNTGGDPLRITRTGSQLFRDGVSFQWAGINWEYAVGCGLPGAQPNSSQATQFFNAINPQSATRIWCLPGMDLGQYDMVFDACKAAGRYLIVTLFNGNNDCTSFAADYSVPLSGATQNWITQVVSRHVNEPTIMAYECANEANEGAGNVASGAWYEAVGVAVKAIDPNVLIATGGGNNSNNSSAIATFAGGSHVDLISYHGYYSPSGSIEGRPSAFNAAAVTLSKPWYVGERGFCCGGGDTGSAETNGPRLTTEYGLYLTAGGHPSNCVGYNYWDFRLNQPEAATAAFGNGLYAAVCNWRF